MMRRITPIYALRAISLTDFQLAVRCTARARPAALGCRPMSICTLSDARGTCAAVEGRC
jgi:hypothetical protein